jgi:hypothetical protein
MDDIRAKEGGYGMREKQLFLGLSAAVWFVNACMAARPSGAVWSGLAISFISIPTWILIGSTFASVGLFLFRLARVDVKTLSLWQKADIGLAMAVVLKPALGIPF